MLSTVSRIIDRKCDGDGIKRLDAIPEAIDSDSAKRPDILVFDEKIVFSDTKPGENPINSIEFKRPVWIRRAYLDENSVGKDHSSINSRQRRSR